MRAGDVAVARVDRVAAFGRLAETHLDGAYRLATFILFAAHCGTQGRLPEARGTRPGRSDSPEQTNANSSTRERAAIAPEDR